MLTSCKLQLKGSWTGLHRDKVGLMLHALVHPLQSACNTRVMCCAALCCAVLCAGSRLPQPAEEPDWKTNPFEMTAVDGYLCGRGTSDNKGPVLAFIYAVKVTALCLAVATRARSVVQMAASTYRFASHRIACQESTALHLKYPE
eukprot:GHRQ01035379.1.p1 GENE.GHRQ01035379.1~~GHRQ01035379.1.p1  ORF type:complete len:145 (+),score=19.37 GHRQ01035379.1:352-786(+)